MNLNRPTQQTPLPPNTQSKMIRTNDANDCLISNEEQILSCNDVDGKDDRSKREREAIFYGRNRYGFLP